MAIATIITSLQRFKSSPISAWLSTIQKYLYSAFLWSNGEKTNFEDDISNYHKLNNINSNNNIIITVLSIFYFKHYFIWDRSPISINPYPSLRRTHHRVIEKFNILKYREGIFSGFSCNSGYLASELVDNPQEIFSQFHNMCSRYV